MSVAGQSEEAAIVEAKKDVNVVCLKTIHCNLFAVFIHTQTHFVVFTSKHRKLSCMNFEILLMKKFTSIFDFKTKVEF